MSKLCVYGFCVTLLALHDSATKHYNALDDFQLYHTTLDKLVKAHYYGIVLVVARLLKHPHK